jgi:hypothetical protein
MTAPYFYLLIVSSLPAFTSHPRSLDMMTALRSPNGIWSSDPLTKVALLQVLINHICDCEWLASCFEPLPDLPQASAPATFESQAMGLLAAPIVTWQSHSRRSESYRHDLLPHSRIVPVTTDPWNRSIWAIQGHLLITDVDGCVCHHYWHASTIAQALRALASGCAAASARAGPEADAAAFAHTMLPVRASYTQALEWLLTWSRGLLKQQSSYSLCSFDSPKLFTWRNQLVDHR